MSEPEQLILFDTVPVYEVVVHYPTREHSGAIIRCRMSKGKDQKSAQDLARSISMYMGRDDKIVWDQYFTHDGNHLHGTTMQAEEVMIDINTVDTYEKDGLPL